MAQCLIPLGRYVIPCWIRGGFGSHWVRLCLLPHMGQSYRWINRPVILYCSAPAEIHTSLKMHFFSHLLDWSNNISYIFILDSLIMIATKVDVTLNHFEISIEFSLALLHWVLFMYNICLLPTLKLYSSLLL